MSDTNGFHFVTIICFCVVCTYLEVSYSEIFQYSMVKGFQPSYLLVDFFSALTGDSSYRRHEQEPFLDVVLAINI